MVKPRSGLRVTAVSLFLAVPSLPLWAQTASEHFPNDDGGANVQVPGTMNVTVVAKGVQNVKTNAVGGGFHSPRE